MPNLGVYFELCLLTNYIVHWEDFYNTLLNALFIYQTIFLTLHLYWTQTMCLALVKTIVKCSIGLWIPTGMPGEVRGIDCIYIKQN